jgi:hypothetical protein
LTTVTPHSDPRTLNPEFAPRRDRVDIPNFESRVRASPGQSGHPVGVPLKPLSRNSGLTPSGTGPRPPPLRIRRRLDDLAHGASPSPATPPPPPLHVTRRSERSLGAGGSLVREDTAAADGRPPVHADAAAAAEPLAVAAPLFYDRKRVCKMCVKVPISCWFSTWQIANRNANAFIATRNSRINAQPENITKYARKSSKQFLLLIVSNLPVPHATNASRRYQLKFHSSAWNNHILKKKREVMPRLK